MYSNKGVIMKNKLSQDNTSLYMIRTREGT